MDFIYRLTANCGWAEIEFSYGDFTRKYPVEYCLGDTLTELLSGMVALSGFRKGWKPFCDIANHYQASDDDFAWSPHVAGTYTKFIFNTTENSNNINLKIIEQFWNNKEHIDENCVFDKDINLDALIDSLLSSCDYILKNYGIIGYYENFWEEFPVSYYLLLKDYMERKINYDMSIEEDIEGKIVSMCKTDIYIELDYLSPGKIENN